MNLPLGMKMFLQRNIDCVEKLSVPGMRNPFSSCWSGEFQETKNNIPY